MSQSNPSAIATAYDEWAATYDIVENRTRDLAGEVLRRVDLKVADRTIIEVGCGTGRNTEWLARSAPGAREIIALDFSEAMLARAQTRVTNPSVRFVQHDIRDPWPVGNATAEIVIVMLILEHVADLQTVFAEARRVSTSGGELFICELHPMRQLLGGQAQFTSAKSGERQLVPAFLHNVSDYVNTGLAAGFELIHLGEWRDDNAPPQELPRLLSLNFRLPATKLSAPAI